MPHIRKVRKDLATMGRPCVMMGIRQRSSQHILEEKTEDFRLIEIGESKSRYLRWSRSSVSVVIRAELITGWQLYAYVLG